MTDSDAFLAWLTTNLDSLFEDEEIQRAVGKKLAAIDPAIRWEAGPHDAEHAFFAFSPNLDIRLLPITEQLAQAAPVVPGWVFLSSKPRKKWQTRTIRIRDSKDQIVQYNFGQWSYYLTSFKDGEFFDVNLVPCGYEDKPLEDLKYAASLFVEFELGERMFMEFVDRANIVLPAELKEFGNKIEHLHDQLLQEIAKKRRH